MIIKTPPAVYTYSIIVQRRCCRFTATSYFSKNVIPKMPLAPALSPAAWQGGNLRMLAAFPWHTAKAAGAWHPQIDPESFYDNVGKSKDVTHIPGKSQPNYTESPMCCQPAQKRISPL